MKDPTNLVEVIGKAGSVILNEKYPNIFLNLSNDFYFKNFQK